MADFLTAVGESLLCGELPTGGGERDEGRRARLAEHLQLPISVVTLTPGFVESRHVLGLYVDRRSRLRAVAKTPRQPGDLGVEVEAALLDRLANLAPALRGTIPEVLASTTSSGRPVLILTALAGRPLTHNRAKRDPRAANTVRDWLLRLPGTGLSSGGDLLGDLLEPDLHRLESILPSGHELHDLAAATRDAVAPLREVVVPRVFEHGDPSHPNLQVSGRGRRRVLGVVDWELAVERGAPGHDLAQFLAFVAFARAGVHGVEAESSVFRREFGHEHATGRVSFASSLGDLKGLQGPVPSGCERPLFALAWARSALRILDRLSPTAPGSGVVTVRRPSDPRLVELLVESRNAALWRLALQS